MTQLQSQIHSKFYWLLSNLQPADCIASFAICLCIFFAAGMMSKRYRSKPWILFFYSVALSAYLTFVLAVTLLGRQGGTVNTVHTIFSSFTTFLHGNYGILYDLAFNAILFVPIGFLLKFCFSSRLCAILLFAQSLIIETTQLLTGRGLFEAADLITNTLGGLVGIWISVATKQLLAKVKEQPFCPSKRQ